MSKLVIEKQESNWFVVYLNLQVMKVYQGAYKTLKKAKENHPTAKYDDKNKDQ